MSIEKLTGLIAAPHTPFKANGDLDCSVIPQQVELLIKQGVKGAYISGTTGEGISCSVKERLQVMDAWKAAAGDRLKLIVHTGALSLRDVETLARHANELKVFATSTVPANYFKPANVAKLTEFCAAAASYAPDCKFYYYHTSMSGINLSMVDFIHLADKEIPNFAGIKFNHHDLYEYQNCLNALDGKYDIVHGVDEFFAGALALGAKGFIGSTFNYSAELYLKIWDAFERNDKAEVLNSMKKVCAIVDLLVKYGGVACGKALMGLHGLDLGTVRMPLSNLTAEQKASIVAAAGKLLK